MIRFWRGLQPVGLALLLAMVGACAERPPAPVEFTCNANGLWQNTGLTLRPGDRLSIAYESGVWTADIRTGMAPPAGNPHTPGRPNDVLPNANRSALIGRIGDAVFLIGNAFDGPAPAEGRLECIINTDITKSDQSPFLWVDGSVVMQARITHPKPACAMDTPGGCFQ